MARCRFLSWDGSFGAATYRGTSVSLAPHKATRLPTLANLPAITANMRIATDDCSGNTPVMILRAFFIWLIIAVAEMIQGILRVRYLNRRVGDRRARQFGVVCGSVIILSIAWLTMPWIGASTMPELFCVGGLWLALMLAFDLAIGRWLMRFTWSRIVADFDPRRGGWLGAGMLVLFAAPWLVTR